MNVYPDLNYFYTVSVGEMIELKCTEKRSVEDAFITHISFGSMDEMKAVAQAMLKVVAASR